MLQRIPWQVSGAIGWTVLAASSTLVETIDRETPANAASHGQVETEHGHKRPISPEVLIALREHGYIVIDGVLPSSTLNAARAEIVDFQVRSIFQKTDQHSANTRSDSVVWLNEGRHRVTVGEDRRYDPTLPAVGLGTVLRMLRGLAQQLEGGPERINGFTGRAGQPLRRVDLGVPPGAQLACYAAARPVTDDEPGGADTDPVQAATGGARYVAHRDGVSFGRGSIFSKQDPSTCSLLFALMEPSICMRELTCIVYLSEAADWAHSSRPVEDVEAVQGGRYDGSEVQPRTTCQLSSSAIAATSGREFDNAAPRLIESAETARSGALLLYLGAEYDDNVGTTAPSVLEILPVGGRLVIFDSRTILHEVCPHTRDDVDRVAMTVWLGGPSTVSGFVRHGRAWWFGQAARDQQ